MAIRDRQMLPKITTLTLTSENTTYTHTFLTDTKFVEIYNRGAHATKYAFSSADMTAGSYKTIPANTIMTKDKVHLKAPWLTWYFQSASAGDVLEIEEWQS